MCGGPLTGENVASSLYWASRIGGRLTSVFCVAAGSRPGRPTAFKSLMTQHHITGKRVRKSAFIAVDPRPAGSTRRLDRYTRDKFRVSSAVCFHISCEHALLKLRLAAEHYVAPGKQSWARCAAAAEACSKCKQSMKIIILLGLCFPALQYTAAEALNSRDPPLCMWKSSFLPWKVLLLFVRLFVSNNWRFGVASAYILPQFNIKCLYFFCAGSLTGQYEHGNTLTHGIQRNNCLPRMCFILQVCHTSWQCLTFGETLLLSLLSRELDEKMDTTLMSVWFI